MLATTTRWYRSEPVFDPVRLKRMLKHRVHIPHRALLRSFYTVKVAEAEEATSSTLISSFSLRCITKFQHAQKYGWVSWRRSRCSHTYTHTHTHSTSHWHTLTQLQVATRKITPSSSPPPPTLHRFRKEGARHTHPRAVRWISQQARLFFFYLHTKVFKKEIRRCSDLCGVKPFIVSTNYERHEVINTCLESPNNLKRIQNIENIWQNIKH